MPNLYCKLPDSDFASYAAIQEIITVCSCRTVKEKELPEHVIIHISFFTEQDKLFFLGQINERLPAVAWREKL